MQALIFPSRKESNSNPGMFIHTTLKFFKIVNKNKSDLATQHDICRISKQTESARAHTQTHTLTNGDPQTERTNTHTYMYIHTHAHTKTYTHKEKQIHS